jgi:hypothetical protein
MLTTERKNFTADPFWLTPSATPDNECNTVSAVSESYPVSTFFDANSGARLIGFHLIWVGDYVRNADGTEQLVQYDFSRFSLGIRGVHIDFD